LVKASLTAFHFRIYILPQGITIQGTGYLRISAFICLNDNVTDEIMPARKAGDKSLSSRLLRTHVSTTSSSEDLEKTAAVHKDALAAAQEEHRRVRESALRAYRNNELKEAKEKLLEAQLQEAERLRLEAERAELAAKVLELQKKHIPIPSAPAPPPLPPPPEPKPKQGEIIKGEAESKDSSSIQRPAVTEVSSEPKGPRSAEPSVQQPPTAPGLTTIRPQIPSTATAIGKSADVVPTVLKTNKAPANDKVVPSTFPVLTRQFSESPVAQKYLEIHKKLKQLRAFIMENTKKNPALKNHVGEMRRQIRKSVGQLTEGKGANSVPVGKLTKAGKHGLLTYPRR
jgi:nucleoporin GLE1